MPQHQNGEYLATLEGYRQEQTERMCIGRSELAQRILRENPLRLYPPGSLPPLLNKYPPVDHKSAPGLCNSIVTEYGGDDLICRSEQLQLSFSFCLKEVTKAYAADMGIEQDDAHIIERAYRLWWGIIVLNNDDTKHYPPSNHTYAYWKFHAQEHSLNYTNWCYTTAKHAIRPHRSHDWEEFFALNTVPMLHMAFGSRLPLEYIA